MQVHKIMHFVGLWIFLQKKFWKIGMRVSDSNAHPSWRPMAGCLIFIGG
jgi:hypothetical protein